MTQILPHPYPFPICSVPSKRNHLSKISDSHTSHQHKLVHLPKSHRCFGNAFWGCSQRFATISAMMIHLESGRCPSGANYDQVLRLVRFSGSWREPYLSHDEWPMCPSCSAGFDSLSGLLQHVESEACGEGYDTGSGTLGDLMTRFEYFL